MLPYVANHHHLPAVIIGGFGMPSGPRSRDAVVAWRRREWSESKETAAHAIGWINNLYRLTDPPDGADPDQVDSLWTTTERYLHAAIKRLAHRRETFEDQRVLVNYVAAAGVRHPHFGPAFNRWRAESRLEPLSGDQIQAARLASLAETLKYVRSLHWRVLHSPKRAHRFILCDRGWTYIGQEERDGRGFFVPLTGRVALLAWSAPGERLQFDHRDLRPTWVKWLNAATWDEASYFVVGHPEDASLLARLRTANEVGPSLDGNGPYRGSDALMFDP
jgi:hypothetical protein